MTPSASLAVAAAALALAAAQMPPEPPIGSRLGDRLEKRPVTDDQDASAIAHELAACVAKKKASAARGLLSATTKEEAQKLAQKLSGGVDCFMNIERNALVEAVQVAFPHDIMRGNIAEELLKEERTRVAALGPLPIQKQYNRAWHAVTGRHVALDEMATCVADTNPAGVMALIGTAPFTDSENAALGSLVPYFGPCLQAGTKLEGKREPVRAALAEALYQRLNGTQPALTEQVRK